MSLLKLLFICFFYSITVAADLTEKKSFPYLSQLHFSDPLEKTGLSIEIETERLKLTTLKKDDFSAYLDCFEDPAIYEPYGLCGMTREDHEVFFNKLLGKLEHGNPGNYYCLRLKGEKNKIIGFAILAYERSDTDVSSDVVSMKNSEAEVAIAVLPAYQKMGYGTEGLSALISIFCNELLQRSSEFKAIYRPNGLVALWALVNSWNFISQKLLKKIGFKVSLPDDGCGQIELRKSISLGLSKL